MNTQATKSQPVPAVAKKKLSREKEQELKEAFSIFDADGDQKVEVSELKIILEAVN